MTSGLPNLELPLPIQPEKPVVPKPLEVKAQEKPIGQGEQKIIDRIDKDGDPDQVLKDIAGGQTPAETKKTPFEQFLDNEAEIDKTPIVGGEIISPTAVRVDDPKNPDGSINFKASQERGWLSAITSAYGKQELAVPDRQQNVQEIVDAALKAGVPKETISTHLKTLGINAVVREQVSAQPTGRQHETTEQQRQPLTQEQTAELKRIAAQKARKYELEEQGSIFSTEVSTPTDLMIERSKLSDEVGQRFHAHGIAKGFRGQQFDSLINLLDNGIDPSKPFYTADLYRSDESEVAGAIGAAGPYDTGGFIVLGEPKRANQHIGNNDIPDTGVAGVLVNREWYDAIPHLQEAYPKVRFIRADQMNQELSNWVQTVDKK